MKINRISFKNINSLRGEFEIDFTKEPLANNQLFAIIGPTGSGKSTILDVISLALFNRTPRFRGISLGVIKNSGAILTKNMSDAFAAVEYECKKGRFKSTWEISTNRNNNLNDYHMEIVDLQTGKLLDLKKSKVPPKNEELIGLSYDQFVKSIVLAQGDFAEFLKVSRKDRSELLEQITGQKIYRQLGAAAYKKNNEFGERLSELRKKTTELQAELLSEENFKQRKAQEIKWKREIVEKETIIKTFEDQQRIRKELTKLQKEITIVQDNIGLDQHKLDAFNAEHGEALRKHEATLPYGEELRAWQKQKEDLTKLEQELEALQEQLRSKRQEQAEHQNKVQTLLHKEIKSEELIPALNEFQSQVEELNESIQFEKSQFDRKFSELQIHARTIDFNPEAEHLEADQRELKQRRAQALGFIKELEEGLVGFDLDNLGQAQVEIEESLETLREGKNKEDQANRDKSILAQKEQNLAQAQQALVKLPVEIEKALLQEGKIHAEVQLLKSKIENQELRASLEEKRHHLVDGKPCPLCGAEEHPWAKNAPPVDNRLREELKLSEQSLLSVREEITQKNTQQDNLHKQVAQLESQLEIDAIALKELKQAILTSCAAWVKDGTIDWEQEIKALKQKKQALRDWNTNQQELKAIDLCLPLITSLQVIREKQLGLEQKRNQLFAGDSISRTCEELRGAWSSIDQSLGDIHVRLEQCRKQQKIHSNSFNLLRKTLLDKCIKSGFDSIEQALRFRLSDQRYLNLNKELNSLYNSLKEKKPRLEEKENSAKELLALYSNLDDNQLNEEITQVNQALCELKQQQQEAYRIITNQLENQRKIQSIRTVIDKEEKTVRKWELLNTLIGDKEGRKFNDFAQGLTLKQLLALANNRLAHLNDRYQIDTPAEDEDDSLVAIDSHMGGQRRSVKTLSGGETFILSLALALALSDLAARNVEINSLFIDEGFGTLDPETLDQTLDTLERLQTESSKTIGVISHVEALKERISTQIRLERNGQGYSTLRLSPAIA